MKTKSIIFFLIQGTYLVHEHTRDAHTQFLEKKNDKEMLCSTHHRYKEIVIVCRIIWSLV